MLNENESTIYKKHLNLTRNVMRVISLLNILILKVLQNLEINLNNFLWIFPDGMIAALDKNSKKLGVSRQSFIKMLLSEELKKQKF